MKTAILAVLCTWGASAAPISFDVAGGFGIGYYYSNPGTISPLFAPQGDPLYRTDLTQQSILVGWDVANYMDLWRMELLGDTLTIEWLSDFTVPADRDVTVRMIDWFNIWDEWGVESAILGDAFTYRQSESHVDVFYAAGEQIAAGSQSLLRFNDEPFDTGSVPEPATYAICGLGLGALTLMRRCARRVG